MCNHCGGEMSIGQAIKPVEERCAIYAMPVAPANADTMKIIDCYKCPLCGHSESIDSSK